MLAEGEHGRYREIESALREQYAAGVIEWTARQGGLGEAVFIAALVCTRPWLQHGLIVFQVREQSRDSDVSIEPLGRGVAVLELSRLARDFGRSRSSIGRRLE